MALQDIPVFMDGYTMLITEAPAVKMKEVDGQMVPVVDRRTQQVQYVVVVFAKPKPTPDGRKGKGEEIKVNLPGDPGEGFEEGSYVELINPVINTYEMKNDQGRITGSGLWFKASGLKPLVRNAGLSSAA